MLKMDYSAASRVTNIQQQNFVTPPSKRKNGVIKMDLEDDERCSHTTVPPSAMMTLAMELQVSNRGKASKMFRKAKENSRVSSPEDEREDTVVKDEAATKLPELWVVPNAAGVETSQTASHLQPVLKNADFVFTPEVQTSEETIQGKIWEKDEATKDYGLNEKEQEFFSMVDVSDLVGSNDYVIRYEDDSDLEDNEGVIRRSDNAKVSVLDPTQSEATRENAALEMGLKGNDTSAPLQLRKETPLREDKEPSVVIDKLQKTNRLQHDKNESQDSEAAKARLLNRDFNQQDPAVASTTSYRKQPRYSRELDGLQGRLNDDRKLINSILKVDDSFIDRNEEQQARGASHVTAQSEKSIIKRSNSLSELQRQTGESCRSATPEMSTEQHNKSTSSSLTSSSLSSSLFSVSSFGSVSSTSLHFSTVSDCSRKTSVASCPTLPTELAENRQQQEVKSTAGVEMRKRRPEFDSMQRRRNASHENTSSCPKLHANDYANANSERNQAFGQNSNVTHTDKSRSSVVVKKQLSPPRSGAVSPSRKVVCEYVSEKVEDRPVTPSNGPVITKAVFPDHSNPGLASPVLHFERNNRSVVCSGCFEKRKNGEMFPCCCCPSRPKAPDRGDSYRATRNHAANWRRTDERSNAPLVQILKANIAASNARDIKVEEDVVRVEKKELLNHPVTALPNDAGTGINAEAEPLTSDVFPSTEVTTVAETVNPRESPAITADKNVQKINQQSEIQGQQVKSQPRSEGCRITLVTAKSNPSSQSKVLVSNPVLQDQPALSPSVETRKEPKKNDAPPKFEKQKVTVIDGSRIFIDNTTSPPLTNNQGSCLLVAGSGGTPYRASNEAKIEQTRVRPLARRPPSDIDRQDDRRPKAQSSNSSVRSEESNMYPRQASKQMSTRNERISIASELSSSSFKSPPSANEPGKGKDDVTPASTSEEVKFKAAFKEEYQAAKPALCDIEAKHAEAKPAVKMYSTSITLALKPPTQTREKNEASRRKGSSPSKEAVFKQKTSKPNEDDDAIQLSKIAKPSWSSPVKRSSSVETARVQVRPTGSRLFTAKGYEKVNYPSKSLRKSDVITPSDARSPNVSQPQSRAISTSASASIQRHMVGNDDVKQVKVMTSAPPHSATEEEEFSGVVEPPPIKVRDIRAMFKRGPDYEDYAKPKPLTGRRNSENLTRRSSSVSSSHSNDADFRVDDVTVQDTQVTKKVMNLFKGALEIESDPDVFTSDTKTEHENHVTVNNNHTYPVVPPKPPKRNLQKHKENNGTQPQLQQQQKEPQSADFKTQIAQIKTESAAVESFDESLDQFYDVLNDLSAS